MKTGYGRIAFIISAKIFLNRRSCNDETVVKTKIFLMV